jgi:hypothetical protein
VHRYTQGTVGDIALLTEGLKDVVNRLHQARTLPGLRASPTVRCVESNQRMTARGIKMQPDRCCLAIFRYAPSRSLEEV